MRARERGDRLSPRGPRRGPGAGASCRRVHRELRAGGRADGPGYDACARQARRGYCSISGFAQTGPWRSAPRSPNHQRGVGMIGAGAGDERLHAPRPPGRGLLAAAHAMGAIMAALWRRAAPAGRASRRLDAGSIVGADSVTYASCSTAARSNGNPRPDDRHRSRTLPGEQIVGPRALAAPCSGHEQPELGEDPRFATR